MFAKKRVLGRKCGMTQLFDSAGNVVPCTVIQIEPSVIVQVKTQEKDGYKAVQFGFEKIITKDPRTVEKRVSKPLIGHFKKAGIEPRRFLFELRVEETEGYVSGDEIGLADFDGVKFVDVTGTSKGKGHQGVMKRYGYAGGPASHGSGFHRHGGSTGMRSTPGRCVPGTRKSGHMGSEKVTIQSLSVVKVDLEKQLMFVEGAIPGPTGSVVSVACSTKR